MAFASAVTARTIFGDKRIVYGTFTNGAADTGGNVETGLRRVESFHATHTGAAVVASAPAVNETFPLDGGAVTIVTVANADGVWFAVGE